MTVRTGARFLRGAAIVVALAVAAASVADARGMGGMGGGGRGGRQSGRATRRSGSQEQLLVQNAFRRDNLRRARHVDW
jgi:hypothetical protein